MKTVSLGSQVNIGANDLDGVKLQFPYAYRGPDSKFKGTITVTATGGDLKTHQLGSNRGPEKNEKLVKKFRAFAVAEIEHRVEKDTLKDKPVFEVKYRE